MSAQQPVPLTELVAGRNSAVRDIAQFFAFDHLPTELRAFSVHCHDLAYSMIRALPDSPELTAGLRKLLEAKDCFVRARVAQLATQADGPD